LAQPPISLLYGPEIERDACDVVDQRESESVSGEIDRLQIGSTRVASIRTKGIASAV